MESPLCPPSDPGFRLIETFGYVPGDGCVRLSEHLARMARSAGVLGITFDEGLARQSANELQSATALRCRLTLDRDGAIELTASHMATTKSQWILAVAPERLVRSDPWLRHKTTRRETYDNARANLPEDTDELLFLNEQDEVCEGSITNVFVEMLDGRHLTPPQACGLLPGVLRQSLIESGEFEEQVLTKVDLYEAKQVYVGNSLRGLIPAILT